MAFVEEFQESSGEGGRRHSTCVCGWRVAERDGVSVLQLDTYGSPERQQQGTISQSLQLTEERARELVDVIRSVFPTI